MDQNHQMNRYARQEILPEVGKDGQNRLSAAQVLVVGAGGLAAPVLPYLAGAGVGEITVVDPDSVNTSNLPRQTLFHECDVGLTKADCAARAIQALNSAVKARAIFGSLTPSNAHDLVAQADIILDCADSFAASYTLSDTCLAQRKPLISASVLGFEGYVGGFCGTAPSLRAVFPDLPMRAATCATAGVMGPTVGTLGAIQAQMALNTLLNLTPFSLGQILTLNLKTYRASSFRFDDAPEPDAAFRFISPEEIAPTDHTFDLRNTTEAPSPVTDQAIRKTVQEFEHYSPSNGTNVVLVCRSGLRAWQAATKLRTHWDGPISLVALGDLTPQEKETIA